jgi:hypothetical protein
VEVDDDSMLVTAPCTALGVITPLVQGGVTHTLRLTHLDGGGQFIEQSPPTSVSVPCGGIGDTGTCEFSQ